MSKLFVTILKFILPMIAQTVVIYSLLLIADWITIYYLDPKNPLLIFAYLSLVHLITVPLLNVALNGNTKLYTPYAILNGLWILITIILMFIIYFDARESLFLFLPLSLPHFIIIVTLVSPVSHGNQCFYFFILHLVSSWSLESHLVAG